MAQPVRVGSCFLVDAVFDEIRDGHVGHGLDEDVSPSVANSSVKRLLRLIVRSQVLKPISVKTIDSLLS